MTALDLWQWARSAPRALALISSVLSGAFLMLYMLSPDGSTTAVVRPLLGAILWNALGWYVAEHGESGGEQGLGTVALLLAIVTGAAGVLSSLM